MDSVGNRRAERPRERGGILAFTGMALLTLVGMTVVGVDLGRLAFTATEVQTVAEVAATGYAHAWLRHAVRNDTFDNDVNVAEALPVIGGNRIDGQQATDVNVPPGNYVLGSYDFATDAFAAGVEPFNAVRATATTTVNNFFATLFGMSQSTVTKNATATLTCGNRAQPLPLLVQDCQFGGFDGPEECADLPTLTQQNVHVENTCWTSLLTNDSANANDIGQLIDDVCCGSGPGTCSLPGDYPVVSQGQNITVLNGQANMLQAMQRCWDNDYREFIVPITPCGAPCNQTNVVSGFAKIVLTSRPVATGNPKYIELSSFCNHEGGEGSGGNCSFGNFKVAMVQ